MMVHEYITFKKATGVEENFGYVPVLAPKYRIEINGFVASLNPCENKLHIHSIFLFYAAIVVVGVIVLLSFYPAFKMNRARVQTCRMLIRAGHST